MSAGQLSRRRSISHSSRSSRRSETSESRRAPLEAPKHDGERFEACAATASFFLYAQRSIILCLHHDTLAIERRFERHREDVLWISADIVSERGAGRLVVSYDVGQTTIVWDLMTGGEVARFASFEEIRVATWMRNGNIAFGNSQGNVILFEPSTSEHISKRTIFDPVTALAPAADCRTFAIGYQNGSILIATLTPSFTILHTLSTSRTPSPMSALAWHGSSSKQKSEMLATQTADGDLRVWSIPKGTHTDSPSIIRVLNRSENRMPGPCWFSWSKMGRIVQYSEGQTYAWDVRTKKVTYETVPTIDGLTAIANYGPTATLFTLGRNHTVQQYDLNPNNTPVLVANVQHVPANAPPSPPNSIEEKKGTGATSLTAATATVTQMPLYADTESSEGEGVLMSPLEKIAREIDQMEEERRDRVGPLSPNSSRSSVSSRSNNGLAEPSKVSRSTSVSKSSSKKQLFGSRYNNLQSPGMMSTGSAASETTQFSYGSSVHSNPRHSDRQSISTKSVSSTTSSKYKNSGLRQEVLRSPDDGTAPMAMDLFPFVKARLSEVTFRPPQYDQSRRTPDDLRQQMLSIVFGWEDDIEALVRDELSRHLAGSASGVLLARWLGDLGADLAASMVGSASMTSSDWMLLALSAMGHDSQKKVGEAFVQRLLEKGDIHPAVAILLGLGEHNDAIEVYVSQRYYMEAVLLTCLLFPADWQRQQHLVRKWGEVAVSQRQPELAVRCFSCTSIESSEPWFSPRAQDAVYTAQQHILGSQLSPPVSPPVANVPARKKSVSKSGLKLITDFGKQGTLRPPDERTPMNRAGVTPIAESALSPGGADPWLRPSARGLNDTLSARTATPGAFDRKRFPSTGAARVGPSEGATPLTVTQDTLMTAIHGSDREERGASSSRAGKRSAGSQNQHLETLSPTVYTPVDRFARLDEKKISTLPSPAHGIFTALKQESRARNGSRDRKPEGLQLHVENAVVVGGLPTSYGDSVLSGYIGRSEDTSPLPTSHSTNNSKIRSIDEYVSSLEEANFYSRQRRTESRQRTASRDGRARSRTGHREPSEIRGRAGVRYIKPAKRSPSSPVSMSPEDAGLYAGDGSHDDERYYRNTSPIEPTTARGRSRSNMRSGTSKVRSGSKASRRPESPDRHPHLRAASKTTGKSQPDSRRTSPQRDMLADERGRGQLKVGGSVVRSPSSPLPMSSQARLYRDTDDDDEEGQPDPTTTAQRLQGRQRSTGRHANGGSVRHEQSPDQHRKRQRSHGRGLQAEFRDLSDVRGNSPERAASRQTSRSRMPGLQTDPPQARGLSRKEIAARELEERRLSLARRPSAPVIPHPGELSGGRPPLAGRSMTELGNSPTSYLPPLSSVSERGMFRSHTVDPDVMNRHNPFSTSGTSTSSTPIGLPATPRAMRHPRYMSADPNEREAIPVVPEIPEKLEELQAESFAPLLPATVYGRDSIQAPLRSMSVPLEMTHGAPKHPASRQPIGRRGSIGSRSGTSSHARNNSTSVIASIGETLHEEPQVIILEEPEAEDEEVAPPVLPELQHLVGPLPPPPPPSMFRSSQGSANSLGVINIAIDDSRPDSPVVEVPSNRATPTLFEMTSGRPMPSLASGRPTPVPSGPTPTGSPNLARRSRGSVSENMGHMGLKLRTVRERMRSTSRSRAKSPPTEPFTPSPYESVLPPVAFLSHTPELSRTMSPPAETPYDGPPLPPPPPMPPSAGTPLMELVVPPEQPPSRNRGFEGYRAPKEIRANMPPEQLQSGVYQPPQSGMI